MRKEEVIINCDLYVQNSIKSLPEDDEHCAIYLRGEVVSDGEEGFDYKIHPIIFGKTETLCATLLQAIENEEVFRALAFDAMLNYFCDNPDLAEEFFGHLKAIADD